MERGRRDAPGRQAFAAPAHSTRLLMAAVVAAAVALLAAALVFAAPAVAHPEADASTLRPDVVRAWHAPDPVLPGTHFTAGVEMAPGSNVTRAMYQVCETRVAGTCFAPPHPARREGDTFLFESQDYLAGGEPVRFEAGWRLGVKWILEEARGNGTALVAFPPQAPGGCGAACTEDHYLVFDVADAPAGPEGSGGSPAPAAPSLLAGAALLAVAAARRRHA